MASSHRARALGIVTAALLAAPTVAYACSVRTPTQAASLGPHDFSTPPSEPALWRDGDDGEPLFLRARVLDTCGNAVAGARVQILHANAHGDHDPKRWRTVLRSNERGALKLTTVVPGYAGGLPRHIHVIITHPQHPQLVTRLFFKNDPTLDKDLASLALVLEEVQRGPAKGWVSEFEFVLPARK